MQTLYELLGAHPDDDADGVKSAFREAVKAHHPDLNAGDPEAASRFRQITAAKAILTDAAQRAIYDELLAFERWKVGAHDKRGIFVEATRNVLTDTIAVAVLAAVLGGGYVLFTQLAPTSRTAPTTEASAARQPPPEESAVVAAASDPFATYKLQSSEPSEPAPATDDGTQAMAEAIQAPSDPDSYRRRGVVSYRLGDIDGAIADFDQAIRLDPGFAAAYIDRGIAFYRLNERDRAFADIEHAMRLENPHRHGARP